MEKILILIFSHLIGDYVLQTDFIAKTKSNNIYHLLVHCLLYIVPFYLFFGLDFRLLIILISHIITDLLKAKEKINYFTDQLIHYVCLLIY